MGDIAKVLITTGALLIGVGVVVWLISKTGAGRLPGDIIIHRRNVTFIFPIVTCILISAVLTLLMWVLTRLKR